MKYKIIKSNSDVNVIEVNGEVIQLSVSIDIDTYLARKYKSLDNVDIDTPLENLKPKSSRTKKTNE